MHRSPSETWGPNQTGQPFDPQFKLCETDGGWNQSGMIVPQSPKSGSSVDEASTAAAEIQGQLDGTA